VRHKTSEHRFDTVVIGGGQAGLAVGYHLAHQERDFVILDAASRVGDAWRSRWDSLRLFTPARYSGLPGMPFPAPDGYFPTKDEMADYLQRYAARFALPVRLGVRVDALTREEGRYLLSVGDDRLAADHVVVATGPFQHPHVPAFASELDPQIVQLHSSEYRNPDQLQEGDVLVVGAGNSGAEIALELAATRRTYLSGRATGRIPLRLGRGFWWFLSNVLTVDTPLGRKARKAALGRGTPLIRLRPKDVVAAGVERVPRTTGVRDGQPVLADERVLGVANVLWCTGFAPDFRWIALPVVGEDGYPVHYRGVVEGEPGLYVVGLQFLYALTSSLIGGVGRDAAYVCEHIAARSPSRRLGGPSRPSRAGRRTEGARARGRDARDVACGND
jgi:putative flavoprotein involved in K+ transport